MPRGTVFSLCGLVNVLMWIHACLCLCFCVIRAWCEWRTVQVWVRWAGRSRSPGEVKRWGPYCTRASVGVHPHHTHLFCFFRNVFVYQAPGADMMSSNFTSFISCESVEQPVIDLSFFFFFYIYIFKWAEALLHFFLETHRYSLIAWSRSTGTNISSLCRGSGSCWLLHSGAHPWRACSGGSWLSLNGTIVLKSSVLGLVLTVFSLPGGRW